MQHKVTFVLQFYLANLVWCGVVCSTRMVLGWVAGE